MMRWTGFRAQLTSSLWQALMQRTLTEASFLEFRGTDGINEKEEGWRRMGRKGGVVICTKGRRVRTDRHTPFKSEMCILLFLLIRHNTKSTGGFSYLLS